SPAGRVTRRRVAAFKRSGRPHDRPHDRSHAGPSGRPSGRPNVATVSPCRDRLPLVFSRRGVALLLGLFLLILLFLGLFLLILLFLGLFLLILLFLGFSFLLLILLFLGLFLLLLLLHPSPSSAFSSSSFSSSAFSSSSFSSSAFPPHPSLPRPFLLILLFLGLFLLILLFLGLPPHLLFLGLSSSSFSSSAFSSSSFSSSAFSSSSFSSSAFSSWPSLCSYYCFPPFLRLFLVFLCLLLFPPFLPLFLVFLRLLLFPPFLLLLLLLCRQCERGETDDEGIERDSGDSEDELDRAANFTMADALQVCESRLTSSGMEVTVCEHYRAVVRALVAEALDLVSFLQKVALGNKFAPHPSDLLSSERDLQELQREDWARLWIQVMRQLREGVKLKKVEYSYAPIEYALTPYEMLMEDIRYTLNKVMVNGDIPPRVKKDAHTIILDFIRSRPPLRKASERKLLPPPRKISSPMELLMESIRKDHNLKHVSTPTRARPMSRRDGKQRKEDKKWQGRRNWYFFPLLAF
ncbi:putative spire, partial [Penaeus vannamei]